MIIEALEQRRITFMVWKYFNKYKSVVLPKSPVDGRDKTSSSYRLPQKTTKLQYGWGSGVHNQLIDRDKIELGDVVIVLLPTILLTQIEPTTDSLQL